jgi:hypothetical protein
LQEAAFRTHSLGPRGLCSNAGCRPEGPYLLTRRVFGGWVSGRAGPPISVTVCLAEESRSNACGVRS